MTSVPPAVPPDECSAGARFALVCVYYRVAVPDADHAIAAVREFQRTLSAGVGVDEPQVLLRFELPNAEPLPPSVPDRLSSPSTPSPAPAADATLMETYRVALPAAAGSAPADAAVRAALATIDAAVTATGLATLRRSARHVELFVPCAS